MVAPVVVFWQALIGNRLLAVGDGYVLMLPFRVIVERQWRQGHVPAWNPFGFSGYPLLAAGQAAPFYPPNWLIFVASPRVAYNIGIASTFAIAGVGAFLLARRLWHDAVAATVAGTAFGLTGFLFAHVGHANIIASACWMPWVLLGLEVACDRFSALRVFAMSAPLALALYAGHPEPFFTILLVLAVYAAVLAVTRPKAKARSLLVAGAGVVLALGLAAPQILPTQAIVPDTPRQKLSYDAATMYSYPKTHLSLLLFPYLFGNGRPVRPFVAPYHGDFNLTELSGYAGTAALVLAVVGLRRVRRDRRVVALAAVAAASLIVALGRYLPTGHLVHGVPVYGQFRAWARFILGFDLAVALLAGAGVVELRRSDALATRAAAMTAVGAAGVIVVGAFVLPLIGAVHRFLPRAQAAEAAVLGPTAAAAVTALVALAALRYRDAALPLLAVIVAVDLVLNFGLYCEWRRAPSARVLAADLAPGPAPPFAPPPGTVGLTRHFFLNSPEPIATDDAAGRRLIRMFSADVTGLKELRSVNGYEALIPKHYTEVVGEMSDAGWVTRPERISPAVLDVLRVSVVLADARVVAPLPIASHLVDRGAVAGSQVMHRYEYRPRTPDAWLVGAVRQQPLASIDAAMADASAVDPRRVALVDGSCEGCPGAGEEATASPGAVVPTGWRSSSAAFTVTADRPGLLVVSQAWFRGWRAFVDGRETPVVRVDGLVQGVTIGPGHHHVALRYVAPGLKRGAAAFAVTVVIFGAWTLAGFVRRRPAATQEPPQT